MRRVYQAPRTTIGRWASLAISLLMTAVLFGILPFSHLVAKPGARLELRKASTADLPPPEAEEPPPPIEESKPPQEAPPEPPPSETPPPLTLTADLEVATGAGGALAGFGTVQHLTDIEGVREETLEAGQVQKPPELVSAVSPVYPAELRRAKVEGRVVVVFLLDEQGRVSDPRVESSTRPEFERPALEAIRKWKFKPGENEGAVVKTHMRQPIRFRVSAS